MTVYVDDMYKYPIGQYGRMKMSHMIADTTQELLGMAQRIGVAAKWIQHAGTAQEHFDVAMSSRAKALQFGAVPITYYKCARMCSVRKRAGVLPHPDLLNGDDYTG